MRTHVLGRNTGATVERKRTGTNVGRERRAAEVE